MKNKAIIRQLISQSCEGKDHCKITQRQWAVDGEMVINDVYRAICLLQEGGEIKIENGTIYKTDKFKGE